MTAPARRRTLALALPLALPLALLLAGCTGTVNLEAAPEANALACAEISVRLPDTVGELERRSTNAQATAAWGEPTAVIYRCGLPPIGPSDLPCFTVDGVDWLLDDSNAPSFSFVSYGRTPVTEVIVDNDVVRGPEALRPISAAVAAVPAEMRCLDATDVFGGGTVPGEEPAQTPAPEEQTGAPEPSGTPAP
ncbi:DUF3515 family protein [Microcella daejeonensis]|uniref:DUF3515 family protein n=1 Tax=Microcella daejeonensis TaxID=2994971 RepID=A0A9E8ML99_9MICO|nr:DUF3515 family protein [Microcella daejeonensis]WAB81688.1 DUF3515 family protein [Microcella daejeonensis]